MSDVATPIISDEMIEIALKKLVKEGQVFILCPFCKNYLSEQEENDCLCKKCDKKFNKRGGLYLYNKSYGQNN